jgi:hypothetical protein
VSGIPVRWAFRQHAAPEVGVSVRAGGGCLGPEVGVLVRWHSPVGPKSWTNSAPRPRRFWRVPARKCQPTCSRPSSPKNRPWCGQDAVRGPAG